MASNLDLFIGPDGMPALILQGASVPDPDTKSGNPNHEIGTGRFGTGAGRRRGQLDRRRLGAQPRRGTDATRPDVLRRRDAVVDAARQIQDLSDEDALRALMRQRWSGSRTMTEEDVASFMADARRQRLADVTDALYNRIQRGILQKVRVARVDFPRGWLKASISGLSDDELRQVLDRLRARGVTEQDLKRHVISRFDDERKRLANA